MRIIKLNLLTMEKIFPFGFVLDQDQKIVLAGRSLRKLSKEFIPNAYFSSVFHIKKPVLKCSTFNFDQLLDQLVVLEHQETKAKLIGQFIQPHQHQNLKKEYIFIGSLSVSEIDELVNLSLDFNDFPLQDQVFDFLMLTQSQRRIINEAEKLNEKLRQAHKEAQKLSELKSQFLANMSHELRTPMNGVLGMASLLIELTQLDDEQREYSENIIQSAENMLELINDILDISKIESGNLEIYKEEFALRELTEEVSSLLNVLAIKKNNKLNFNLDFGATDIVYTDKSRLRQILMNLVGNSNKFTNNGQIDISFQKLDLNFGQFSIRDQGIGMSEETLTRIFKPFVQGDSSMSKKFGGTGLGLSISRRLTELLGGKIQVKSDLGKGSEFQFTFRINK